MRHFGRFFILLFITILFSYSSIFAQQTGINSWSIDLNNLARVYAITIDQTNPSIIYCGGLDSGVYKSINGGLSWIPINSGMTYFHVQTLIVAPSNGSILYAGTDQNGGANSGIYVSTNAGTSWTLQSTGITDNLSVQQIVVSPTNPSVAYATVFDGVNAATIGLYKTTNMGTSWAAANSGITNFNLLSLAINPLNANVVYAGSSLILPASTGPSHIFRSNNAGANWFDLSNGLPTGTTTGDPIRAMSISTSDTATVLAGLFMNDTAGGVYVTTNSGTLWTKKYGGLPNAQATLFRSVMIKPGTNNQFVVGLNAGGIYRSTDQGNTWTSFASGPMLGTYTIRSLVFSLKCDTLLFAGAATATNPGNGVFDYTWPFNPITCDLSWTVQTSGTTNQFNSVKTVNILTGWAVGNTTTVRKTTNGGANWIDGNPNPGVITGDVYFVDAIDANTAWVTTAPSATFVYRTTNGGTNWTQVFTQAGGFIDAFKFSDANNGFMYGDPVGGRWSLWKTTNGGLNWDSTGLYLVQNSTEAGYNNALTVKGTNIWFGTGGTRVYHSTNYGTNWTFGTTGDANSFSEAFNDLNIGMVGGGVMNYTTNGGANYSTITVPGTGNIFGVAGQGNYFWYVRGFNVYMTSNMGTNWITAYTGATNTLYALDLNTYNCCPVGWTVGLGGVIVRLQLLTGITGNNNEIPKKFALSQNYPNPFNPSTKITYQIPVTGNVKLVIYDLLGREVKTLINEVKQPGTYLVDFDGANFASGIYFYKLESGTYSESKKMIILK